MKPPIGPKEFDRVREWVAKQARIMREQREIDRIYKRHVVDGDRYHVS